MEEEREKAWVELRERYQTNVELLNRVSQQERSAQNASSRLQLVLSELKALPDNVPTFRQIGRAYFLEPKSSIVQEGEQDIVNAVNEAKVMHAKKSTLEQKLRETQQELQEMTKT